MQIFIVKLVFILIIALALMAMAGLLIGALWFVGLTAWLGLKSLGHHAKPALHP